MFSNSKYVGIALESNAFKYVVVQSTAKGISLVEMDQVSLVDKGKKAASHVENGSSNYGNSGGSSEEKVFGFDSEGSSGSSKKEEVDFSQLEAEVENKDIFELSGQDKDESVGANYIKLYNTLKNISPKHIELAMNVEAGETIFQTFSDENYRDYKEKELTENIEEKLHAIYDEEKSSDYYAYEVREDGSLVLASIDDSPSMLNIVDETKEFYQGKLRINEIYSDETALVGLFRTNYDPEPSEITALIQFGSESCRVVYLQGNDLYLIPPPVGKGTKSQNFLSVVFSKILFQLDSGEIPGLNRIVIANNSVGDKAVEFLAGNFPNSEVENFKYKDTFLDKGFYDEETLNPFTTAIALGAAVLQKDEAFPKLSMLPEYVIERQKIFKLEWHGIILLVLIFLNFPVANYYYQRNTDKIASLSEDLGRTKSQIAQVQPIVNQVNEISNNLSLLTSKLSVLDSLSRGSKAWSVKLHMLNSQMSDISNTWFASMHQAQNGTVLEGYTLYRNRIPAVVDIFDKATLVSVNTQETREQDMHKFSIIVQQFSADSSVYSPEKPAEIGKILNN